MTKEEMVKLNELKIGDTMDIRQAGRAKLEITAVPGGQIWTSVLDSSAVRWSGYVPVTRQAMEQRK